MFSCYYFDDDVKREIFLASCAIITLTSVTNLKSLKSILLSEDFLNVSLETTLCRCLLVMLLQSSFFISTSLRFTEATVYMLFKTGVPKTFAIFTEKHLC